MFQQGRPIRSDSAIIALAAIAFAFALVWAEPAHALARFGVQPDARQRLWLAAFSGFTLGLAIGLFAWEIRARGVSIALRRLTGLAASIDGRLPADPKRGTISQELDRLSDEVLYATRKMTRQRRESDEQATSWQAMFAATLDSM